MISLSGKGTAARYVIFDGMSGNRGVIMKNKKQILYN